MVDSKRYDPTITRFKKHTQSFVSDKTKKGHLNDKDRDGDVMVEEGILVHVVKKNISGNGWKVKIGNKEYMCTYGDNIIYLPPYTETAEYYVPKYECPVEVRIDKKSDIKTITRLNDPDKRPIRVQNDMVRLNAGGDASITIKDNTTSISGSNLSVGGDITVNTSKDNDLPDKISITEMYKEIKVLKAKVNNQNSDNNGTG